MEVDAGAPFGDLKNCVRNHQLITLSWRTSANNMLSVAMLVGRLTLVDFIAARLRDTYQESKQDRPSFR